MYGSSTSTIHQPALGAYDREDVSFFSVAEVRRCAAADVIKLASSCGSETGTTFAETRMPPNCKKLVYFRSQEYVRERTHLVFSNIYVGTVPLITTVKEIGCVIAE
jgi:hypothetical protein